MKLKVEKDTLTIEEGGDSLVAKMIKGCKGNIILKARGVKHRIKKVKDSKGKILHEKKGE